MVNPSDPRTAVRAGLLVTAPARVQRPMKGMAMILVAVLLFAMVDTITKHLTMRLDVPSVMAFRYFVAVAIILAVLLPRQGIAMFRARRRKQVFIRSATMAAASFFAASAFNRLPVAETTAIIYLAPFGVLFLSGLVLGEKVRLGSWIAACGGFLGLVLITRPGGGLEPLGVALALGAAALSVWYYLSSRLLAETETTEAMLFYSNLAGAVLFGVTLPFNPDLPLPPPADMVLLVLAAACATGGHFLLTAAYREAPAGLISPLLYVHLIWAGLLGRLAFGHVPDVFAAAGIAIVAVAGAGLAVWNYRGDRRARA